MVERREYKWARLHPEQKREIAKRYTRNIRRSVIDILGNKCIKCKIDDFRVLQIDHINGDGKKEKIRGSTYWNKVIKSFKNNENKYQLLCANCNWIKRVENKESPGRPIK